MLQVPGISVRRLALIGINVIENPLHDLSSPCFSLSNRTTEELFVFNSHLNMLTEACYCDQRSIR